MRIYKLDGLRGIFSLMIVFFHYREAFLPEFMHQLFFVRQAYTFVDFFFVLSGYVIAFNYNQLNSFKEFKIYIKKRFVRLFPLLFFTTTLTLIFDFVGNFYLPSLVNNVDSLSVLLLRYMDTLFFTNSCPILGSTSGINGASWSISSEMISYLAFGIISIYTIGKRKNLIIATLIFICIAFSVYNGSHFNTGDYGFIRGLISFNFGFFVWYTSNLKTIKQIPNVFEYMIPVMLLIIFYVMHNYLNEYNKEMFGLFIVPIFFSLSIAVLLRTNGGLSNFLSSKPLVFLGDISYSIYLNHALMVIVIPKIIFSLFKVPQNTFTELFLLILIIALTIIVSNYTYLYIEKKGGKVLRNYLFEKN